MPDRLTLVPLPPLQGERVLLRRPRGSDIDDRLHHPIDPGEEDAYGSSWRREWDGRRYHARDHLAAGQQPDEPGCYTWAVEHEGHCIGSAGLRVDADQHGAVYTVGLFVAGLRGRGLGEEITRLVLSWTRRVEGLHPDGPAAARILPRLRTTESLSPGRVTSQPGAWAPVIMAARSSGCRKDGGGGGPQANRPRAPSRSSGVHSWSSTMQSMSE